MSGLENRVALVTGSSRGIGAAIASLFAAEGARVAVHGRDAAAVESVRADIEAAGGVAMGVVADLTAYEQVDTMRATVERTLGPIDVVVANAGGSPVRPGPFEEISEEDWRSSVDANLTATFFTLKAVLPGMKERGRGAIVTMSSSAARRTTAMSPIAYAAAKAGIEQLTKNVAAQAGPFGIRANCIAPEIILTERNLAEIPDDVQESQRLMHPIRRLGLPDDIARAALFFATDNASWITGTVLDVAGGSVFV